MSRLDPAAALRAGKAAATTMPRGADAGSPKVKVLVPPPVGTGPEPPSDAERVLAASPGNSPQHRMAREKLVRNFYQSRMGLGAPRCAEDLPHIDLNQPVEIALVAPPARLKSCSSPGGTGNFFAPADEAAPHGFEVTEALEALNCSIQRVGLVLLIDDATRDHRLRPMPGLQEVPT